MLKKVVIIGRANVGKSTLFNRLAEKRFAMVSDIPGTTRDLKYAPVTWRGQSFELIDTGGFLANQKKPLKALTKKEYKKIRPQLDDDIDKQVEQRARQALEQSDLVILVLDVQHGLNPQDKEIAAYLRQTYKRPVIACVNKCDNPRLRQQAGEFYQLGLGEPLLVSAVNGSGTGDLLDVILKKLGLTEQAAGEYNSLSVDQPAIKVSIIGKPNVGKSSLLNKLIGYEKVIVSSVAHTTREPNDETIIFQNRQIKLIDTAGIRRKAKVDKQGLESLGIKMSLASLKHSEIALLVLDISRPISHQDLQLGKLIVNQQTGVIIVANKYDLLKQQVDDPSVLDHYRDFIYQNFPHLKFAPIIFTSAKSGLNTQKILKLILEVDQHSRLRISDNALAKFLKSLIKKQPPPRKKIGFGSKTKIKRSYITNFKQISVHPPLFECAIGSREKLPEDYRRYIINNLRAKFGFQGVPIKLVVRYKKEIPEN